MRWKLRWPNSSRGLEVVVSGEVLDKLKELAQHTAALHAALGDRVFDDHAIGKHLALRRKLESGHHERLQRVVLGPMLDKAAPMDSRRHYEVLPKDFLTEPGFPALPPHATVVVLNNDVGARLNSC